MKYGTKKLIRSGLKASIAGVVPGAFVFFDNKNTKSSILLKDFYSQASPKDVFSFESKTGVKIANDPKTNAYLGLMVGVPALLGLGARIAAGKGKFDLTDYLLSASVGSVLGSGLYLAASSGTQMLPYALNFKKTKTEEDLNRKSKMTRLLGGIGATALLGYGAYNLGRHYHFSLGKRIKKFVSKASYPAFLGGIVAGTIPAYLYLNRTGELYLDELKKRNLIKEASSKEKRKNDDMKKILATTVMSGTILPLSIGAAINLRSSNKFLKEIDDTVNPKLQEDLHKYIDKKVIDEIKKHNVEVKIYDPFKLEKDPRIKEALSRNAFALKGKIYLPVNALKHIENPEIPSYFNKIRDQVDLNKVKENVRQKSKRGLSAITAHELKHATSWHTSIPLKFGTVGLGMGLGSIGAAYLYSKIRDKDKPFKKTEILPAALLGLFLGGFGGSVVGNLYSNIAEMQADSYAAKLIGGRSALRAGIKNLKIEELVPQSFSFSNKSLFGTFRYVPPKSKLTAASEFLGSLISLDHPSSWSRIWDLKTLRKIFKRR